MKTTLSQFDGADSARRPNIARTRRVLVAAVGGVLFTALSVTSHAQPVPYGVPGTWTVTFQEEFTSATLNGAKWRMGLNDESAPGQAANSHKSIRVDTTSGRLRLTALNQSGTHADQPKSFLAGEISTFSTVTRNGVKQGFAQKEGYFEARMKYPAVKGLWPSFWLMPDRGLYGNTGAYERSYLRFNLTGQTLPGTITSAKIRLKVAAIEDTTPAGNKNNTVVMGVPNSNDSWTETGVTWNTMPIPDPEYLDQRYNNNTVGSTVELDVTEFVQNQIAVADRVFSFCLADTFMKTNRVTYHSREAANSADRPVLIINNSGTYTFPIDFDATVKGGSNANANYGTASTLTVRDDWGNTASTLVTTGDQRGMEIDIMEYLGVWGPNCQAPAIHWDGYNANGIANESKGFGHLHYPALSGDFHVYGLYWKGTTLELFIDGVRVGEYTDPRVINVPSYMILSLQLGGWDGNSVTGSTIDNKTVEVDYVRAWSGTRTADVAPLVVDNTSSGYVSSTTGWSASTSVGGYYGSNYVHDGNTGKGTKTFDYIPGGTLPTGNGDYFVYARWPAAGNYSASVPYTVTQSNGTTFTTYQNQQTAGGAWNFLGAYTLSTANVRVSIANAGTTGHVIADAVRFRPYPTANIVYVDNAQGSETVVSNAAHWVMSTTSPGYLNADYEHDNNTNKGSAVFRFKPGKALPPVGSAADYIVYARWTAAGNRANNVPYDIKRVGGLVTTVTVNQQLNNNVWVPLGVFNLDETSDVAIRNAGTSGYVIADAVRFVPLGTP